MDRAQMCNLFRTCATGDLSGLDEPETKLVAWLALVAMLNLGEGRTETES
jgi:hypothetical protein